MMRNVIIGDIHGCYNQLLEILEKVHFDEEADRFISLGDLMDRGPEPYSVFSYIKELKQRMGDRCVLVRGNHEQMLLDAYIENDNMGLWKYNGGGKTIRDFYRHGTNVKTAIGWIRENTVLYYLNEEEGFQCAHADIQNEDPAENDDDILIWGRENISSNTYTGRLTIVGHTPLSYPIYLDGSGNRPKKLEDGEEFPLPLTGMICIDTGCVFRGALTALLIESGLCHIVQVTA